MELRVLALEARVKGIQPYSLSTSPNETSGSSDAMGHAGSSKTAMRRVHDVTRGLENIGEGSDALKRFFANYDSYRPLLDVPGAETGATGSGDNGDASQNDGTRLSESDLISGSVKRTMVLEAARDIQALERDLRRVETFSERSVDGAGQLEELLKLSRALESLEKDSKDRRAESGRVRRQVGDVLVRYNEYNETVSGLFLDIHQTLEALEDKVARAERKKRKELQERY